MLSILQEIDGAVDMTLVDKFGGQDAASLQWRAIEIIHFIYGGKCVSYPKIVVEINITTEKLVYLVGNGFRHIYSVCSGVQISFYLTSAHKQALFKLSGQNIGFESIVLLGDEDLLIIAAEIA